MGMNTKTGRSTSQTRSYVLTAHRRGKSNEQIAEQLDLTLTKVRGIIDRYYSGEVQTP